ncbi:MAG TPA: type II toxin-antitoxin system YafQ family toxin [Bacteroidia bacterium]|nr:type II toxin-antitoxin system YafQ family toxin [Bacteroidia bacterium]
MRITQTTQFKKDINKQTKRSKDLQKLKEVIELLVVGADLPPKSRDHSLAGSWIGWRDCHLEPDWLLIYKVSPDELILGRTGTHSDLF